MSMYNMIMGGPNRAAPFLLAMLGFADPGKQIPRLRDCYLDADHNIVVFTRTGGGNREEYTPENHQLTLVAGFVRTEDWELDTTYAKWVYTPPQEFTDTVKALVAAGAVMDPTTKFNTVMAALSMRNPGPVGQAALERAKPLVQKIEQAVAGTGSNLIMVDTDSALEEEVKH